MDAIRLLIVDDNIRLRWSLIEALVGEESIEIVDEASDGNEAVEKALALKPEVILMDLYMPNCTGVEAARRLRTEAPDTKVLMFTVSEAEADLMNALQAGARGYLLKDERPEQIVQAIHYVARGGVLVSPAMATMLAAGFHPEEHNVQAPADGIQAAPAVAAEVTAEESRPAEPPPAKERAEETPQPVQQEVPTPASEATPVPDD